MPNWIQRLKDRIEDPDMYSPGLVIVRRHPIKAAAVAAITTLLAGHYIVKQVLKDDDKPADIQQSSTESVVSFLNDFIGGNTTFEVNPILQGVINNATGGEYNLPNGTEISYHANNGSISIDNGESVEWLHIPKDGLSSMDNTLYKMFMSHDFYQQAFDERQRIAQGYLQRAWAAEDNETKLLGGLDYLVTMFGMEYEPLPENAEKITETAWNMYNNSLKNQITVEDSFIHGGDLADQLRNLTAEEKSQIENYQHLEKFVNKERGIIRCGLVSELDNEDDTGVLTAFLITDGEDGKLYTADDKWEIFDYNASNDVLAKLTGAE